MITKQIEHLIAEIKKVCSFDIRIVPVKRRKLLLVIKYPSQGGEVDLHDWAVSQVHPLHWEKIYPLIKKEGYPIVIRSLYCCDDNFVFYSPDFGFDVFCDADFPICYDSYGYEYRHKYVGNRTDVSQLITFLQEKASHCF